MIKEQEDTLEQLRFNDAKERIKRAHDDVPSSIGNVTWCGIDISQFNKEELVMLVKILKYSPQIK